MEDNGESGRHTDYKQKDQGEEVESKILRQLLMYQMKTKIVIDARIANLLVIILVEAQLRRLKGDGLSGF